MHVLNDLREWLKGQPEWLNEALNRWLTKSILDDQDITDLTELCKRKHGLSDTNIETQDTVGPVQVENIGPVNIRSINHVRGVNALAENQKIEFQPNLTVVYGDNGAGKSGYTRILKQACKARGVEEILGNVFDPSSIVKPKVKIEYSINEDLGYVEDLALEDSPLHMVNVFDSHSASVYLNEKTDVAFRPFGLDLYDKLSSTCEMVKKRLETESSLLSSSVFNPPSLPSNTKASDFLNRLSARTTKEEFDSTIKLKPKDITRLATIEKMIVESKKSDKGKLKTQLEVRKSRVESLKNHFKQVEILLSDSSIDKLIHLNDSVNEKKKEFDRVRNSVIDSSLLQGTGNDYWRTMWKAAGSFSANSAYSNIEYPNTSTSSKCVLCQQDLSEDAKKRFKIFNELIQSVAERDYSKAKDDFSSAFDSLVSFNDFNQETERLIEDIKIESSELAKALENEFKSISKRKNQIIEGVNLGTGIDKESLPKFKTFEKELGFQTDSLTQRIDNLELTRSDISPELIVEKNELEARRTLTQYESVLFAEVERRLKIALYNTCLKDVRTNNITRKSSAVTKEIVSQKLKESFLAELKNLSFDHVEVELIEAGGERGTMYHKLVLSRAKGIEVPKVASEGESRCLSIAAFLAELSTADDPSAILFDDPVSSLDHKWRTRIAHRLVEESKSRQVIVFTHDLFFLLELQSNSEDQSTPMQSHHLRRHGSNAGTVIPDLPWKAMKVRDRIKVLNSDMQEARKMYKDGNYSAYDSLVVGMYGKLRETWERAFEEVLLNRTVERYRRSIQTMQISSLTDITDSDIDVFTRGMTISSKWLSGHDLAREENEDVPKPDDIEEDINSLKEWVQTIRDRRK